jgi:two-component system phosphate regulon response regulator PhoB
MSRILFVEDEINLQTSLSFILEREGHTVTCVATGEEALQAAAQQTPDLVLLDVNLPGMDGFAVCQRLRARPDTSDILIMLVTARTSVDDVVQGFDSFADDYVTKPFHPRVLLARIQALLRRRGEGAKGALGCQGLVIDPGAREVRLEGRLLDLTKTEFDLLTLFASQANHVFSRTSILDVVRGSDTEVAERTVDFQISGLRKKLGSAAWHIETVRGVGYKFVG